MDGLELNKWAAAFLIALLLLKSSQEISKLVVKPKELKESENAYVVEGIGASVIIPAVDTGPVPIEPLLAGADIARGQTLVKQCKQCHTFEKDGKHGIGPNLYGIVGNAMAHASGYTYSRGFENKKGEKWTFEKLNAFLHQPRKVIEGTKMAFAGIVKEEDRAAVIVYLNTLSDDPLPLPKAVPKESKEEISDSQVSSKGGPDKTPVSQGLSEEINQEESVQTPVEQQPVQGPQKFALNDFDEESVPIRPFEKEIFDQEFSKEEDGDLFEEDDIDEDSTPQTALA